MNGILMKLDLPEVLIVYNAHKRDAGTIPLLLSASGLPVAGRTFSGLCCVDRLRCPP